MDESLSLTLVDNHDLANAIKVDTTDSRARICDMQFSRILQVLASDRLPEDTLESCQSFARRRPSWRQPGRDTTTLMQRISDWVFMADSSLFVVQAGPRAESRTKDLVIELTGLLKNTDHPVFWHFSEPFTNQATPSLIFILKSLVFQALRHDPSIASQDPQVGNIRAFETEHTLAEWIGLASKVISKIKQCFVVIETESLHQATARRGSDARHILETFVKLFNGISSGGGSVIKLLIVNYGSQTLLHTGTGNTSRIWAKVGPPLPASRRSTYQMPMQLRRGSVRYIS